jgi:hypothetical protein
MRDAARFLFVLGSVLVLCAGGAYAADNVGAVGTLAGLQVNAVTADTFLGYHGRIFVKDSGGDVVEYRWGGTSCGSRVLTEAEVAALQRALNNKQMRIQPLHQDGQGQALCLVGFMLVPKSSVSLVIP